MTKKNEVDVAISCASEDLPVANRIAASLKNIGVTYYLFTEHQAVAWGENIFRITVEQYVTNARFVLVIISQKYSEKRWAGMEFRAAQAFEKGMLPLRLDDTILQGLNTDMIYENWKQNPGEIALLIKQKLALQPKSNKIVHQTTTKNYNAKNITAIEGGVKFLVINNK